MRPICLGAHVWCMSIAFLLLHSYNIRIYFNVHTCKFLIQWSQAIYGPNFTVLAHSPQEYLMLVGPGLSSTFPLINRRVSINFELCFLLGYLLWRRYWATKNLITSLVINLMLKVVSGLIVTAVYTTIIPITAQRISWYMHIF